MALGESAGILFKIRGDSTDAVQALKNVQREQSALVGTTKGLGGSLASLVNPATLAAAGIAAIGAAGVAAATGLFRLAQGAAEFGSKIFDASQKTGLGAESLSALKFAADQSGSSLEAITAATARFAKTVGAAADGSEEAAKKLKKFGIDPKEAIDNLDGALAKVFKTIVNAKPGVEQLTLAQLAFGRSGAELLPTIKSFDGDMEKLIRTAKELGVTLDDDAARAADEFGDQMDTLTAQLGGVGRTIGQEFMPIFLDMAKSMSSWLSENKGQIRSWAENISLSIQGLILYWKDLKQAASDYYVLTAIKAVASLDPLARHVAALGEITRQKARDANGISGEASANLGANNPYFDDDDRVAARNVKPNVINVGRADSQGDFNRADAKNDLRNEREALDDAKLLYQIRTETFEAEAEKRYAVAVLYAEKEGRTDEDNARFKEFLDTEVLEFRIASLKKYFETVEKTSLSDKSAARELALLEIQRETQKATFAKNEADRKKKETDAERERHEKKKKSWKEHIDHLIRVQELEDAERQRAAEERARGTESGPFDLWTKSWETYVASIANSVGTVEASLGSLSGLMQSSMQSLGGAVANGISQWLLYGDSVGTALRKALAAELAHIAGVAAVNALYATALGFLRLAQWDFAGAGAAFTSAAIWAAVAGVAAIGAKAIAGDSFKRQSNAATGGGRGGQSNSQSSSNRNAGAQGQTYSGFGDKYAIDDRSINAGTPRLPVQKTEVTIRLDSNGVLQVVEDDVNRNGKMRNLILKFAT